MTKTPEPVTGCLILVVGPSGSGKDTLIRAARDKLGSNSNVLFVRRVITRGNDTYEDHDPVSDREFTTREDRGEFSLSWSAHGFQYGIPSSIDADIASGKAAICNVSRTVVDAARSRYRRVLVIEVTAPLAVLALRLSGRAREAAEKQSGRLRRSQLVPIVSDVRIENTGSVEQGAALLVGAIERAATPFA